MTILKQLNLKLEMAWQNLKQAFKNPVSKASQHVDGLMLAFSQSLLDVLPTLKSLVQDVSLQQIRLDGSVMTSRMILRQMMGLSVVALAIMSSLAYTGVFGVYSQHRTLLTEGEIETVVAHVHQSMVDESPMALLFDLPPTHPSNDALMSMPRHLMKASVQGGSSLSPAIAMPPEPIDEWLFWENQPATASGNGLEWPLEHYGISSHYGPRHGSFHHGMDLTAPMGSTIYSVDSGVVVQSGFESGYGRVVTVDHGHGVKTKYAHMGRNFVRVGEWVYRHQMIGTVGMTGRTSGPHLHFEVLVYGQSRNPMQYLKNQKNQRVAEKRGQILYRPIKL